MHMKYHMVQIKLINYEMHSCKASLVEAMFVDGGRNVVILLKL